MISTWTDSWQIHAFTSLSWSLRSFLSRQTMVRDITTLNVVLVKHGRVSSCHRVESSSVCVWGSVTDSMLPNDRFCNVVFKQLWARACVNKFARCWSLMMLYRVTCCFHVLFLYLFAIYFNFKCLFYFNSLSTTLNVYLSLSYYTFDIFHIFKVE